MAEVQTRMENIRQHRISTNNVYQFLLYFDKLYGQFTDLEKKTFMNSFIERVEIFPERQSDGRIIKRIEFRFPVYIQGAERTALSWDKTDMSETIMLLVQQRPDDIVRVGIDTDELSVTKAESKATYGEIQARVKAQTGLNVTPLYIAQVKRKHGIIERECYNKAKADNPKMHLCPPDKEAAIEEALRFFGMIA